MRRGWTFSAVAACLASVWLSGCDKTPSLADQLSPTGGVTVDSLTLTVNTPPVGRSVQASARATFSNGTSTAIGGGFTTNNSAVATSTTGGLVTGVAIGDVTISVSYSGATASKTVHVLPGYDGIWSGTYAVQSCTQTEGFETANFCGQFAGQSGLSIAFSHTQPADLTTLSGQFALGQAVGNATGAISPTGVLTYDGAIVGGTTRMDLRNFTITSPAVARMIGTFEQVWTDSAVSGQAVVFCTNMIANRTSSNATLPASTSTSSLPGPHTLGGLAALIRSAAARQ